MRRLGLKKRGSSIDLARMPMVMVAAALIVVSALFSVTFGYRLGEPSGTEWAWVLVSLAIDGYAAFALPVLWPRLKWGARLGLVAFLVVCMAYKVTAAHRFATENLLQREVSRERQVDDYSRAEQRVADLQNDLKSHADARPIGVVEAEIAGKLAIPKIEECKKINGPVTKAHCPTVFKLREELAKAEAFERTQRDLEKALGELQGKTPVAAVSTKAGGPVPWLLGLFGYDLGSFADFAAMLVMLIVEAGSVLVPALVGFAGARRGHREVSAPKQSPAATSPILEIRSPAISQKGMTERAKKDAAELVTFLGARTERAVGKQVQSTTLYLIYSDWKQGRKGEPMSINQFGNLLTNHLGLEKVKRGGKNWYLNLQLKSSTAGGLAARHLQAIGDARG